MNKTQKENNPDTANISREPIAIVGMGCKFPQSNGPEEFWNLLKNGINAVSEVPTDRWSVDDYYSSEPGQKGKMNSKWGGFIKDIDIFDANFFNISSFEATSMDPQQRILMEVTYEALQDAGLVTEKLKGEKVGVFIGIASADYSYIHFNHPDQIDMYTISGSTKSAASNRISYFFDFKGPSISIDTACSSSLVAVHLAIQSIYENESKMAIAGGVNLILSPLLSVCFSQGEGTSPDGKCKAFDSEANGMVRGEGTGVVILKRLSQAIADNDRIYGVIRGSAVNQDGATNGFFAPSPIGQREVLKAAYQRSGVNPENISYIEAHGTGTELGDPIESKALGEVISLNREADNTYRIGSVKTNIGHLEAAAGIAGLIKTTLSLNKGFYPPSLHYTKPNQYIPFADLRLKVQEKLEKIEGEKVFAGISSFGFGGTNAHVVLENYKAKTIEKTENEVYLLPLTAQTSEAVQELAQSYISFIKADENLSLKDLCYTASCRRDFHNYRTTIVFKTKDELLKKLEVLADNSENINAVSRRIPKLALVYSGMGSQQPGMGKQLLDEPVFKKVTLKCDKYMSQYQDWSLIEEIENSDFKTPQKIERVQATLFALQIGLSELWKSYGLKPEAVVGSSVGEVAAACIAGIISLEDAVKVISYRTNAMGKMVGKGAMAIVQLTEKEVAEYISEYDKVWVSAVNSQSMTVLSGTEEQLEKLTNTFKEKKIFNRMIKGAVAPSHCPLMEPIKELVIESLKEVQPKDSEINMFSTVTGELLDGNNVTSEYWWQNIKMPIELRKTILNMEKKNNYVFLEISPHPILAAFITECVQETGKKPLAIESLKKDSDNKVQIMETLGYLFSLGLNVDFEKFYDETCELISLPAYPWQREYYWLDNSKYSEKQPFTLGLTQRLNSIVVKDKKKSDKLILNRQILDDMPKEQRKELLNNYLQAHVARVLKVPLNDIDISQPLKNLGIGSLMGMELFNRLKGDLEISLPISKFLKGPSIVEIADEIINSLDNNQQIETKITLRKNNENIPLSFPQQRLWFIEQLESGIFAYNIPAALKFEGKLQPEFIEQAVNEIIKRHEILRTVFVSKNNEAIQIILPELKLKIREFDISNLAVNEKDIEYSRLIMAETSELFSLEHGPLLRTSLIKFAENEHIVLLTIHHMVADGLSLKIILDEISTLYKGYQENRQISLPFLPVQYADYSIWQAEQFNKNAFDQQINYWKEKLANIPALLQLPLDKTRPQVQSFNGAMNNFILAKDLLDKLNLLSKEKGVTLFTILLSAFKALLYKYTGQNDIVIGTPIAGRNEPELENLIGMFLNMLALRTEIKADMSFSNLLADLSKTTIEAYDNQDLPFEKIVEIIKPERSMSHTPVFQVIMALHAPVDVADINDLKVTYVDVDMKTSKFDLVLSLIPENDSLRGAFEYNTDLFFPETIENLKAHFFNILEQVISQPEIKISEINILTENEERYILENFSRGKTTKGLEKNVIELFSEQVKNNPDLLALSEKEQQFTYRELDNHVNNIVNYLGLLNLDKNKPVVIIADRSIEMVITILGVLKSGLFYLPLDPEYPLERNEYIISDAQPSILLIHEKYLSNFSDLEFEKKSINQILQQPSLQSPFEGGEGDVFHFGGKNIPLDPPSKGGFNIGDNLGYDGKNIGSELNNSGIFENKKINLNDTAYLIYTSGSTGQPKGVEVSHANLINLVNWHNSTYEINNNDRATLIAGVGFDASVWELFPYITAGASIFIPEKEVIEKPSALINWFENNKITISFLATPLLELIIDEDWSSNKTLKKVLTGGDKLTKTSNHDLPFKLYNHYGPTECTVVSSAGLVNFSVQNIPDIGKPIDNSEIYILDANLKLVPVGVSGEIYIGGKSVAKGYFNHPELNEKSFIENPFLIYPGRLLFNLSENQSSDHNSDKYYTNNLLYKTGDRAKWNKNGKIEFLGRNDSQVKIRGFRIELAEIESAIYSSQDVKECFVRVIEKDNQKQIMAYVVAKENIDLAEYLKNKLPAAAIPKLIYLGRLPLTANGKIDVSSLPVPEFNLENIILPETEVEKVLLQVWKQVLNIENISTTANFFELGGHSLLAMQMIDKITRRFNVDLSLRELFNSPTIKSVSALIEKQKSQQIERFEFPEIIANSNEMYQQFPLTDVQQAYWIGRGNDFNLGNISAHAYLEVDVKNFDIDKFEKAFQKLINRHPGLRTILTKDGTQKVLENVPDYKLKIHDLENSDDINNEIEKLRAVLSHEVLDYDKWPLFNISVSKLGNNNFKIHFGIDALIADALSMVIMAKELNLFYNQPTINLSPLEITFRDYIVTEKKLFNSVIYEKAKNYWLSRLESLPPAPQLPLAVNPADLINPKFTRLSGTLKKEKWQKIKQKAAQLNVTPSVILLGAFSKVLGLWSKSKHFTINLTLFNRLPLHEQVMNLVGDFTSLNLLEVDGTGKSNFEEFIKSIQEQLWQDIDNRYIGGVWVLRELAKLKGRENAAMPVVFTSLLADQNSFEPSDFFGDITYSITQTPQVWLDHQVTESQGNLIFNWDFPTKLFPDNMLYDIFDIYCSFLEILSAITEEWNFAENILLPAQQSIVRAEINNDKKPISKKLLHELFFDNVKIRTNENALITAKLKFSYQELANKVSVLAFQLREAGVKPNELVAVIMEKGWEQIVAVLAINYAGAAYLPLNPEHPKDRNDYLLSLCDVKVAVTQDKWLQEIDLQPDIKVFSVNNSESNTDIKVLEKVNKTDDLAYIIFTSGSTGLPKGVMISHEGAVNTILDINERFAITSEDKVFAISSLNFDLSVYDIFGTLSAGATIVMPDNGTSRDPEHWSELMQKEKVTVWNSVPTLMRMLVEYAKGKPEKRWNHHLKTIMMSGDWIPLNLADEIRSFNPETKVISLGGATEASIWSIYYPIEKVSENWKSIPYGKPLANQSFHILNDDFEPCPDYVSGNLYIGGIGLAKGYYKDEIKTINSFIINPRTGERLYKTGDLGRYLPDGNIEFLGREDSQVKIQGHRIELGEVEAAMLQHEAINDGLVMAYGEARGEKYLVGYIQFKDTPVENKQIINFMETKLPCYMVPSIFIELKTIPVTANGKIDRKALPVPVSEKNSQKEATEIVENLNQEILLKTSNMVKEVLNLEYIDPKADLLSMGANSIDIVKLANLLEQEFGFCPKMGDIFRLKNIYHLVRFYEDNNSQIKSNNEFKEGQIILDPAERERFKNQRKAIRNLSGNIVKLDFEDDKFETYKSHRVFADKPVDQSKLGKLLSSLKELTVNNGFKYSYPSAGSLYPVQTYIHVKDNGVASLNKGIYYYHPQQHVLIPVIENIDIDRDIHFFANLSIYDQSKFSIFFIGDIRAIEPLYGNSSIEYCYIEAGSMAQALRMNAPKYNLGLCGIGQVNSEKVKELLNLDEKYLLLHTLLGGEISSTEENTSWSFISESTTDDEEWEEITI